MAATSPAAMGLENHARLHPALRRKPRKLAGPRPRQLRAARCASGDDGFGHPLPLRIRTGGSTTVFRFWRTTNSVAPKAKLKAAMQTTDAADGLTRRE